MSLFYIFTGRLISQSFSVDYLESRETKLTFKRLKICEGVALIKGLI